MDISVIIPYYNLPSSLLDRCLNSLLPQLARTDAEWEIIIIDDGSKTAPEKRWEDGKTVRMIRQEHGGLSRARNKGMKAAQGDYILFIDADDYIFESSLPSLVKALLLHRPDILRFQMQMVFRNEAEASPTVEPHFSRPVTGEMFMLQHNLPDSACFYFFRRELALRHAITFAEGEYLEDSLFTCRLHHVARSVVNSDVVAYAYYQRPDSIVNARSREHLETLCRQHAKNLVKMAGLAKEESLRGHAEGLQRKVAFYTIDYLHRLCQVKEWTYIRNDELPRLTRLGLYPLPAHWAYGIKYSAFRLIANTPLGLLLIRLLFWRPLKAEQ